MKFSVIVPMYNVEVYAEQCINSVLSQNYTDFELILVNDGSTDSTLEIINKYKESDSRIIVVDKENGGLVSARKAGLKVATGEYVVAVDGDDWIPADCLQKYESIIRRNDVDVVCGEYYLAFSDGEMIKRNLYKSEGRMTKQSMEDQIYPALFAFPPNIWSKAFKREKYLRYQNMVDDGISMGEDGMVVYPCIFNCDSIFITRDPLYYYRCNPQSMTQNKKKEGAASGVILRISHIEKVLPLDRYDFKQQLAAYAIHSVYNVLLSYFRSNPYNSAQEKSLKLLSSDIVTKYIFCSYKSKSAKEHLAALAVRHKLFFIIKLHAKIG